MLCAPWAQAFAYSWPAVRFHRVAASRPPGGSRRGQSYANSGILRRGMMSALGQKQTCALQNVMSALHPIATTKADSRKIMSALPPKADMCGATGDVRFGPKADSRDAAKIDCYSVTLVG